MTAILLGSIGTLADTSELQRQAFNQAFAAHGLDWHWQREQYIKMLEISGGHRRILDYAAGQPVDAEAIHRTKSKIFQNSLATATVEPRAGLVEMIHSAKAQEVKLGLVTATSPENVEQLLSALHPSIQASDFDVIVDASCINNSKPANDAYLFALDKLGEKADSCIAIEDNVDGLAAARSAALVCVAFPGENTARHDFSNVARLIDRLDFNELLSLIPIQQLTATARS
jgi:HAD superfamily hydrolase (TIGR01509 family)